jgi:CubicO group peptidase (beta-lactamase class C family)
MKDLQKIIDQHIENGLYSGVEWKITHKENIFQGKSGYLNLANKKPILENTIYRIWSMTKPIISIVALQLIEEKKITLNDPITDYLPQFANLKVIKNIDGTIADLIDVEKMPTIKDLLSHTAGFSYNFIGDTLGREYDRVGLFHSATTTLEEEINLLATLPLLYQPSKEWVYSVSVDVLARIIEIVTKGSLQSELKKRIFDPLEMKNTAFTVDPSNYEHLMTHYEFDPLQKKLHDPMMRSQKIAGYGHPTDQLTYARGGHGLFSTLDDYEKFAQMLLTGKTKNGVNIISKSMLNQATTNHLDNHFFPLMIINFDTDITTYLEDNDLAPYGWGLGFRVMMDLNKAEGIGSVGEFGWAGAAATYFLVDPKNELTAILMTQVLGADNILKKDFVREIYKNLK